MSPNWTKPYCGVTHLGELGDLVRVTVEDHGSFATLFKFRRGIAGAEQGDFKTVDEAKRAGEAWLRANLGVKTL